MLAYSIEGASLMSVRTRWGFLAFPAMSKYDFDYQLVSFEESLKRVAESLGK